MTIDLTSMKRTELKELRLQVEKAIVDAGDRERKAAIAAAEKAAAEHGFSLSEITSGRKTKSGPKTSAPARYRNPDDATKTWTGKGRQPAWFKEALASGTTPEQLEI